MLNLLSTNWQIMKNEIVKGIGILHVQYEYGTIWDGIILDMTVSFSPNLTIILWVHIPWNVMCSRSILILEKVK